LSVWGDEFIVVLPSSDSNEAITVAERMRQAIESAPVETDAGVVPVTASLGDDVYYAHQTDTPESLIARADACLHQAKQAGRIGVAIPLSSRPPWCAMMKKMRYFRCSAIPMTDIGTLWCLGRLVVE
jgi:predicted signal transduction protein with EAL and GGDEF domain